MSSIKEQVINESLTRIRKRLREIDSILYANPVGDIIELRQEAQKRLDEARENGNQFTKEFTDYISECAKKEKELFRLADKQKDTRELVDEKAKLESELRDLESELYFMDKSNFRR